MEAPTSKSYGFDPAFRHGALVYSQFEFGRAGEPDNLSELKVVYAYDKKAGIEVKSEPDAVFRLVQRITDPMRDLPRYPVAIDWDPQSVYWRASSIQIVQLGLFLGYFTRTLHQMGFPVVYISPGEVREALGLKKKQALKEVMHEWFAQSCTYDESYTGLLSNTRNTDYLDAAILAYLVAKSTQNGGQYTWQFLTLPD